MFDIRALYIIYIYIAGLIKFDAADGYSKDSGHRPRHLINDQQPTHCIFVYTRTNSGVSLFLLLISHISLYITAIFIGSIRRFSSNINKTNKHIAKQLWLLLLLLLLIPFDLRWQIQRSSLQKNHVPRVPFRR